MKTLDLKEVRDRFELYKVAFNKKPYVNNLANELGVKTTTLMKFIVDNDKHFVLYQNDKGTYISKVYLELKDIPGTDEFVEYNKEKYKNTIFLEGFIYPYSSTVSFHYVKIDTEDEERKNEWRNTKEKIEKIKQYFKIKDVSWDIYKSTMETFDKYVSKENIELLISQGWEFVNYNKNCKE